MPTVQGEVNKMNIVLINPTWKDTYGEFKESAKTLVNYPPIGLCYLSGTMRAKGHYCRIIDCDVEGEIESVIVDKIAASSPDLVGITAATTVFHKAKSLAEKIKDRINVPIVIGGPHVSLLREKAMVDGKYMDYGVFGEGEETLQELVSALESGGPVENIAGLIYRKHGIPVVNKPRTFINNPDSIPLPDFGALKLDQYLTHVPHKGIVPFVPVVTSRGCPFACIYCSAEGILGRKVRFRTVENVMAEFEYIVNTLKISHLAFIDETLTLNKKRMMSLCTAIMDKKLNVTMEGWTRASTVDEEMLAAMKKAGFISLSFGIESGDPGIAKVIGRDTPDDVMVRAFDMAKNVGLETKGYLMIGHPYETKQTVENSFRFVRSIKNCDQIYINITTPFPGTKLYDMAKKGEGGMKVITEDYSQYRKYGNAVITVNDLSRDDLIRLQKKGFLLFYLNPRRFFYNMKRAGFKSAMISGFAFLKSILGQNVFFKAFGPKRSDNEKENPVKN